MALNTRLDLRQTQSLVMTPQLQQAIKLLQMSNVEVIQFVEEALEQNPLLERAEGERETEGDASPVAEAADSAVPMEDVGLTKRDEAPLDVPYEDLWTEDSVSDAAMPPMGDQSFERTGSGSTSFDSEDSILEQTLRDRKSVV